MSLLGDLAGLFLGHKADKKTNKLSKEQLKIDRDLANRQIDISKYIEEYARKVAGLSGDITDPQGNRTFYNPATGQYETQLGAVPRQVQDASDREELARYTQDQAIRRQGLNDFERMRQRSVGEAGTALQDVLAFKRGVGRVDPERIGSQLRMDRTQAVNAGYDDAARAAQTLQMRTGSSAVGDALTALARNRVRDTANIGSPEIEALQMSDELNNNRQGRLLDIYKLFGDEGRGFYDTAYAPSTHADKAEARLADRMKFDLSKYDLAMGGAGSAAATIGNAQSRGQLGFQNFMGNRVVNPTGKLVGGLDESLEKFMKALASAGGGF